MGVDAAKLSGFVEEISRFLEISGNCNEVTDDTNDEFNVNA
jgi:hypothetical protein